jgi:hypothetical protein
MNHGVSLSSGITPPRCDSLPELYRTNGDKVKDYSWTITTETIKLNLIIT